MIRTATAIARQPINPTKRYNETWSQGPALDRGAVGISPSRTQLQLDGKSNWSMGALAPG